MKERKWKIEGIFAEAKKNHGLQKAKYRGISKVQLQALMTASIQNIKRLVHHIDKSPHFLAQGCKILLKKYLHHLDNFTFTLQIFLRNIFPVE